VAENIPLTLNGRKAAPALPALLRSAQRGAGEADDPFLPTRYLQPRRHSTSGRPRAASPAAASSTTTQRPTKCSFSSSPMAAASSPAPGG
jgi:hypothetical protein